MDDLQIERCKTILDAALRGNQHVALQLSRALLMLAMEDGTAALDVIWFFQQADDAMEQTDGERCGQERQRIIRDMMEVIVEEASSMLEI